MARRHFLIAAGLLFAAPRSFAQTPKRRPRVGMLWIASETASKPYVQGFLGGLRDQGFEAGKNFDLMIRYADGDRSRVPSLVDELIAFKPDVLTGVTEVAIVMKQKTSTIPIVLPASTDPVKEGLVQSLARPGTNVTGQSFLLAPLAAKALEILSDALPKQARIAFLFEAGQEAVDQVLPAVEETAKAKSRALVLVGVRDAVNLSATLAELEKNPPAGLVMATTAILFTLQPQVLAWAKRMRIPTMSGAPLFAERGGTFSYGINFPEAYRYGAKYVARILKGDRPAELPVEQYARYELVINLGNAREIGFTVPQSIIQRADRVVE